MRTYKNGRSANELDPVVGTSAETPPRVIAGTIQLDPDTAKDSGIVHVQTPKGVDSVPVNLADLHHAEDALLAVK